MLFGHKQNECVMQTARDRNKENTFSSHSVHLLKLLIEGFSDDPCVICQVNKIFSFHPPTGLTIDYFNQRLYWADPELSQIGSMRLDGSDPLVTISERHGKKPPCWKTKHNLFFQTRTINAALCLPLLYYHIIARVASLLCLKR